MDGERIRVRRAIDRDVEVIHAVMVSAFGIERGSERWESWRRLAEGWRNFLVLEMDGEIAGVTRIGRDKLRYGEATILKGDVGYVSVRRELQGRGLGTTLMREVVRFMREEGFHISRLGGLIRFYSRFGYVPFPRRFYEFPIEPARAGAMTLQPEEFLALTPEKGEIRAYEPRRDWPDRRRLYDLFNRARTGSIVEGTPPRPEEGGPDRSGLRWVYEEEGKLHGYIFAHVHGEEADIHGAFDLSHPSALPSLMRKILLELYRRGVKHILGRLPFDHAVENKLVEGGIYFILRELNSYPASNMLLLIDLKRFLRAVTPEWSRRLRRIDISPPWMGTFEIRVEDQAAKIAVTEKGIKVEEESAPKCVLDLGRRDFLLLALGYRGFDELRGAVRSEIPESLAALLSLLFRREPVATGPLG
ncbi:TPA: GNAT family N-acetyltransferase [Candidatus Poribacteria bacterium]|nr:GNAT family N-acetyltransferase [Candidatus Poribacteria bacterium]HEX29541.1 GNAT family N-acetyltransferase [Candidatus Poribacteria bacterium]